MQKSCSTTGSTTSETSSIMSSGSGEPTTAKTGEAPAPDSAPAKQGWKVRDNQKHDSYCRRTVCSSDAWPVLRVSHSVP